MELFSLDINTTSFLICQDKIKPIPSIGMEDTELLMRIDPANLAVMRSAGIICFSIEPVTQSIFVLLGKENAFINGVTWGKWADLGGGHEPGETLEHTAAREFTEESLGVVQMHAQKHWSIGNYQNNVEKMLDNNEFAFKINVAVQRQDQTEIKTYFCKKVKWQPRIKEKFEFWRW